MNFARRVTTFDLDDEEFEVDLRGADAEEKDTLLGGGGGSSGASAYVNEKITESSVGRLRIILLTTVVYMAAAGVLGYSLSREINGAHHRWHYRLSLAGIVSCFLIVVSGISSWIGVWRFRRRDTVPLSIGHTLVMITMFGLVALAVLVQDYWKDRASATSFPLGGVTKNVLCLFCIGLLVVQLVYICTVFSLKWKSAAIFQWSAAAICFVILLLAAALCGLGAVLLQSSTHYSRWPECWSVYGSVGAGAFSFLSMLYALPINKRTQLINVLVLLPICAILLGTSYFNYFESTDTGHRNTYLYTSSLVGIAAQALMVMMFGAGFAWKNNMGIV